MTQFVHFHFPHTTIVVATVVQNLEVESTIHAKAIAQAKTHLLSEFKMDMDTLPYDCITVSEDTEF
jgi:hypothetical protein